METGIINRQKKTNTTTVDGIHKARRPPPAERNHPIPTMEAPTGSRTKGMEKNLQQAYAVTTGSGHGDRSRNPGQDLRSPATRRRWPWKLPCRSLPLLPTNHGLGPRPGALFCPHQHPLISRNTTSQPDQTPATKQRHSRLEENQ